MTQTVLFNIPELEFKAMIEKAVRTVLDELKQQPPTTLELLTRVETAKYLGISLPTMAEWTNSGVIVGYRIGGRVRYKKPDIENALLKIDTLKYRRNVSKL